MSNHADFTPDFIGYSGQGAFRFWCQTVLPLVYDDSLSYYELLNKVVTYLNNVISDVSNVETNTESLRNAYNQLENYVNTYFDNLDIQNEINAKLDEMAENGDLNDIISPYVPPVVENWLAKHITPTSPAVDASLSIAGAAADAKATGVAVNGALTYRGIANNTMDINSADFAKNGQWYVSTGNYPNGTDPDDPHFPFKSGGARIVVFGNNTTAIPGKTQVVISSTGKLAYRSGVSNSWNRWRYFVNNEMIDNTLSISGDAADAKAVGDILAIIQNGNIPYNGIVSETENIDDVAYTVGGQWYVSANYPNGWPFSSGYGRLVIFGSSVGAFSGCRTQLAFSHYINKVAYRTSVSSGWSAWHYVEHVNVSRNFLAPLTGKSLCIVGTSFVRQYTTMPGQTATSPWVDFDKQWANLVVSDFNMTGYNNGLAGCNIAKIENDNGNSIWERLTKSGGILAKHNNTTTDQSNGTLYPGASVDYFIIQGGGNDSSNSVPLGTVDDDTPYTFHGALNLCVQAVRAKYPRAKLFFITCFRRWLKDSSFATVGHNNLGLVDVDYANAMVENARHNSVRVFDAWHNSGLYPYYGTSGSADYAWPWISTNNKHLNVEGNAYVAEIIEKWLNNEGV